MTNSQAKKIHFNNIAQYSGLRNGQDWYNWIVYVDEPEDILKEIKSVEYLLHRSFSNPLRKRNNYNDNFSLESSGWGEFQIRTTVFFKNGSREDNSYYLDLSKKWNPDIFNKP